jgi:predicted Zn-dependent protease
MSKTITALGLIVITTALSVLSFRAYHRDFFYLLDHHKRVTSVNRAHILRIAERVDVQDTRNAAVSMMLGEALVNVGEVERGITVIETQVRLHPDDMGILEAYADALARTGRRSQADLQYRSLLERTNGPREESAMEDPS